MNEWDLAGDEDDAGNHEDLTAGLEEGVEEEEPQVISKNSSRAMDLSNKLDDLLSMRTSMEAPTESSLPNPKAIKKDMRSKEVILEEKNTNAAAVKTPPPSQKKKSSSLSSPRSKEVDLNPLPKLEREPIEDPLEKLRELKRQNSLKKREGILTPKNDENETQLAERSSELRSSKIDLNPFPKLELEPIEDPLEKLRELKRQDSIKKREGLPTSKDEEKEKKLAERSSELRSSKIDLNPFPKLDLEPIEDPVEKLRELKRQDSIKKRESLEKERRDEEDRIAREAIRKEIAEKEREEEKLRFDSIFKNMSNDMENEAGLNDDDDDDDIKDNAKAKKLTADGDEEKEEEDQEEEDKDDVEAAAKNMTEEENATDKLLREKEAKDTGDGEVHEVDMSSSDRIMVAVRVRPTSKGVNTVTISEDNTNELSLLAEPSPIPFKFDYVASEVIYIYLQLLCVHVPERMEMYKIYC
jgi:aspartate beta-hydroxylase